MAHHGDFIIQSVAGIHELVGSDVNLVHRLLKNHIGEATGWRAYALFTEKCLERVGLKPDGLHPQTETYEHLGDIQTHTLDLKARYQEINEARRVFVPPEEADITFVQDFPAPPPIVWDWLNDPYKRNQWMSGHAVWSAGVRPGGRTGVGARNHCAHGKGVSVETIVDWRPFEYVTVETLDSGMVQVETFQFEPLPDGRGTRLQDRVKLRMRLPRWIRHHMCKFFLITMNHYDQLLSNSARMLAEELAREQAVEAAPASAN
jgi:uncharacterized protein YndB with AHSA1/START domain